MSELGFLALALFIFELVSSLFCETPWLAVGCVAASLASIHEMPVSIPMAQLRQPKMPPY